MKILIMAHAMELGGAERALLGILENMDYSRYTVDLFLLRHKGELMRYIPDCVHVLPEISQYASLGIPIRETIKKGHFKIAWRRIAGKRAAKRRINEIHFDKENNVMNEYSHKFTVGVMPKISETDYDVAISFVSPHYFVSEKVSAKKKIAWIHTDYATLGVDIESERAMWAKYDTIVSISKDVTRSFIRTFPQLEGKLCQIENIMPVKYMGSLTRQFSTEKEMPPFDGITFLSVGRFSPQKNFTEVPELCRKICDNGVNLKWYLIGFGMEEDLIRQEITKNGMEDRVIILGKKDNPYPYINHCDVYVQPSRYEGKAMAVREAQILHKPVIITNYLTAGSQLVHGVDGLIVPMEIDACANAIAKYIQDASLLQRLSDNTKRADYVCQGEIKKLYKIMEDDK